MANSLIVFNNNRFDFEKNEIKFIQSNNLLISHQIIMPKSEINRLLDKFDNIESKINPDIFIIDKTNIIITDKFDNKNYCIIFENKQFSIFSNKRLNYKCLLSKN